MKKIVREYSTEISVNELTGREFVVFRTPDGNIKHLTRLVPVKCQDFNTSRGRIFGFVPFCFAESSPTMISETFIGSVLEALKVNRNLYVFNSFQEFVENMSKI